MKKAIDLRKILSKEHADKWIALTTNHKEIIDYSDDFTTLFRRHGEENVTYLKVPASGKSYAF